MTSSTGGQTPTNEPRGGQTSAEAAGSIRDRLRSPDDANADGTNQRGSDVTEASFANTDSAATLAANRGGDEGQRISAGTPAAAYELRAADLDAAAERSAERKVAAMFLLSFLSVVGFVIVFFASPYRYGETNNELFTPLLATLMALALIGIGAGAVKWAKTLMGDAEIVQERHSFASSDEDLAETGQALGAGLQETGLGRRKLLTGTLLLGAGSLAILPLPLLLDLGPYAHKERALRVTAWKKGVRLVRKNGTPVRLGDLQIGSLETVYPDVPGGDRMADTPTMLIRMEPGQLKPRTGREDWSVEGHIAYSVICTHLGCPVKLYEQQTHHLFCPCHQSTFDAANGAKVVFGPAARSLPQLAISVDEEGYFVAQGDYTEPVGPSYWERNSERKS
ncbi:MAG: Rieske (2Fe-2S) protein [Actinobacteria bacterium]|nr:Rieske (2Fe-2S) protein [Actinomycetota bacterium]MCA1721459.1 Rieske (2Fe-2S) protein [Actinomycetota bacterium]